MRTMADCDRPRKRAIRLRYRPTMMPAALARSCDGMCEIGLESVSTYLADQAAKVILYVVKQFAAFGVVSSNVILIHDAV